MEDLSLHILDIAENSINAGASTIGIFIREDSARNVLTVEITDDGKGMDPSAVKSATDPFYTSRTTRRVGLGLPLLAEAARAAHGHMDIQSTPGMGTRIAATFELDHIDRKPIGNMAETITTLLAGQPEIDVTYRHERDGVSVSFSTREIRQRLGSLPVNSAQVLNFIKDYLDQEENSLSHHASEQQ